MLCFGSFFPAEDNLVLRFRGNLVIDGGKPFDEEEWSSIRVGKHTVMVSVVCISVFSSLQIPVRLYCTYWSQRLRMHELQTPQIEMWPNSV